MANSIHLDKQGPDWPLGNIIVVTPGTPVNIMSLVDASGANAPNAATTPTSDEYAVRCNQIIIQGFKANAGVGLIPNSGNLYLVRAAAGGPGGHTDYGVIVLIIPAGQTASLGPSAMVKDVFNPYRYRLDADNPGDAGQVTLLIF